MAEVTINSAKFDVFGNRRAQTYNVTGNTGNTLTTGLNSIRSVLIDPVATNPPTETHSGGVVTFASGGAFTVDLQIVGN